MVLALTLLLGLFIEGFCVERVFYIMGTYAVVDMPKKEQTYRTYRVLRGIENRLSDFVEGSEVDVINTNAGVKPVKVSPLTYEAIRLSLEASRDTEGYFDITVGALTINHRRKKLLSEEEAKRLIDYRLIHLSEGEVFLPKKGMAIDLGGIGKGFALEVVRRKVGSEWGFVGIAGDMVLWGHRRVLAVKDPLKGGVLLQGVNKKDLCISTSGNYIRKHIEQSDSELIQVTVVGNNCALVDAYATAFFAMPREERAEFKKRNPDIGVLELHSDYRIELNEAFRSYFSELIFKTDILSQ